MVQISKHLFDQTCRDAECHMLLHPWHESCIKSIPPLFLDSAIGSAKFYSMVYAVQIAMRGKKMLRKEEWMKMGEYYVRSTLLGLFVTATAPIISCTLRKLLGNKFTYYTYLMIPFTLNGLFIYLEPPSRRGLVINLFCNLGFSTYFGVGLGITLGRLIVLKLRTPIKAISSIRGKHFKLAMFFGSYIGIYRAIVCLLCRKKGFDSALYALPAGYLAGLSFLFSPTLGLSIASVTAALKLYSTILYEKKLLPTSIPLPELMYCIFQGTLFSARILKPDTCPTYVFNLMKTVSSGRSEWINDTFLEVIKKGQ